MREQLDAGRIMGHVRSTAANYSTVFCIGRRYGVPVPCDVQWRADLCAFCLVENLPTAVRIFGVQWHENQINTFIKNAYFTAARHMTGVKAVSLVHRVKAGFGSLQPLGAFLSRGKWALA